jgi:hypothetical protein
MTVRLSTGVRNALAGGIGFASLFNRGSLRIYSGTQPLTADSAVTGTLLGTVTTASGALTQEVPSTGTVTITGGSGSLTAVTVGTFNIIPDGSVAFNTSTTLTAVDLAAAINRNGYYTATSTGSEVTITARPGTGTTHNGYTVATAGTLSATGSTMANGVASVNGLVFLTPSAGVVSKSGVWSMNGSTAGTAGWFRLIGSSADAGAAVSAAPWLPRVDGSVGTSGADMNLSNIVIAVSAPTTIDSFTLTIPAQ